MVLHTVGLATSIILPRLEGSLFLDVGSGGPSKAGLVSVLVVLVPLGILPIRGHIC